MAHYLPPALMTFFQPRPPPEYKPPMDMNKKKLPPIQGVAQVCAKSVAAKRVCLVLTGVLVFVLLQFVQRFKDPAPPVVKQETPAEKKAKRTAKQKKDAEERVKRQTAKWNPEDLNKKEDATKEPYKTLFVSRLSYDVTEDDLKQEFEYYGPVVKVCVAARVTTHLHITRTAMRNKPSSTHPDTL
jgi:U1 small nuclear ribonucleoprotein